MYLPFKVILVAGAPGEADLPDVARPVETAVVCLPPLKHDSGTKHTVNRQMLGEKRQRENEVLGMVVAGRSGRMEGKESVLTRTVSLRVQS